MSDTRTSPSTARAAAPAVRVLYLFLIVAVLTLIGSQGGGEIGRRMSAARGGVGDDLVFAALGSGAIGALALSVLGGVLAAPRLALRWWWGLVAAFVCLVALGAYYGVFNGLVR